MKRSKPVKKTKKPRQYNNSSRVEKSKNNRQKIIENYVALLVEKRGEEISLDELAERADLSTRTLFRFFGDKKSITRELEIYLEQYITRATQNLQIMSVEDFAKFSFEVFDKYENLILAYLYTNFGQTSRVLFRRKFNAVILEKLKSQMQAATTVQSEENLRKMYFIISLINANLWSDLRDAYGESGKNMSDTVKWAVNTLMKNI